MTKAKTLPAYCRCQATAPEQTPKKTFVLCRCRYQATTQQTQPASQPVRLAFIYIDKTFPATLLERKEFDEMYE
jgi:hypothetical protein